MIWYGDRESTGRVTLGISAGLLSRQLPAELPAGLALGRETLGTSLLEECLELSQQSEDPESKGGCVFLP